MIKNGNIRKELDGLHEHADIANREMGEIKTDIKWLKETMQSIGNRTWWILGTLIIGILIEIALRK